MENIFTLSDINWLAVITVTVLSFVLGALWHSGLLFGKAWKEDIKSNPNMNFPIVFGLSAIGNFIPLLALNAFIGANATLTEGFIKGIIVSILWISSAIGVTYLFAGRSFRLFLIDAGYYVVLFAIAGLILAAW
jgi:hypothetical protein